MEDVHGRDIQDAAFLAQGEWQDERLGELAFGERSDIRAHGENEVVLPDLVSDQADTTGGEDEVANGVGFENEDAQRRLHRVGRGRGGAAVAGPVRVEKLAARLVHPLVGVGAEEVALGLE